MINGNPRHSDHRPIIVEVNEEMRSMCGHVAKLSGSRQVGYRRSTWVCGRVVLLRLFEKWEKICWAGSVDLEKNIKLAKKNLEACRKLEINRRNIAREEILKYKLEKLEA